jgi:hypothetical protein
LVNPRLLLREAARQPFAKRFVLLHQPIDLKLLSG